MNRRDFIGASAGLALSGVVSGQEKWASQPNVIWFLGDQHRAQALGINGDPNVRTPNLDNLQAMGVQFTQAVSGFPLCCPFRGSMLTGRYPHHCVVGHEYPLPEGQATITEPLKQAGYSTAYFGKWHLGGFHESEGRAAHFITDPKKRGGFDKWVGYENNNSQYDSWVHGGEGKDAFHYRLPGYETDALTDLLIQYVREQVTAQKAARASGNARPFFAVCSVQPPHDPPVAPPDYRARLGAGNIEFRQNVPQVKSIREQAARELSGYYGMTREPGLRHFSS